METFYLSILTDECCIDADYECPRFLSMISSHSYSLLPHFSRCCSETASSDIVFLVRVIPETERTGLVLWTRAVKGTVKIHLFVLVWENRK